MAETVWGHSWYSQFHFFSITISGDSAAYCLKIVMLISLKGTLTQTRTKLGIPLQGAHEEPICRNYGKFPNLYRYHIQLVFLETKSLII